ncbi:MAG: hypothetical protein ACREKH_18210 [Candidatus Rokuibacteriota bacterium]
MNCVAGSFTKDATNVDGATNTIALAFAPSAVRFIWTAQTAFGSFSADCIIGEGYSDGTNDWAVCSSSDDAADPTDCNRYHTNAAAILILTNAGAETCRASITFSGNDIVVTWDNNDANAFVISYMAWGGVSAKVGSFTAKTTTGTQARTGIGFTPVCGFTCNVSDDTAPPVGDSQAVFCSGFQGAAGGGLGGTTNKAQHIWGGAEDNQGTSDSAGQVPVANAEYWIGGANVKSGSWTVNGAAHVVSWDADGWTEDWETAAANAFHYGYLVLGGDISVYVDKGTVPLATGTQQRTGYGFLPKGVCTLAKGSTSTGVTVDFSVGLGMASGAAAERAVLGLDNDGAAAAEADMRCENDAVILMGTAGTPALTDEAALSSFDADGLTLDWVTVSGSAKHWSAMAFGDGALGRSQVYVIG